MTIQIGLIGLLECGKTTLFNAFTGKHEKIGTYTGKPEEHLATVTVSDPRVDFLHNFHKPKKTVYPHVSFIDIGGMVALQGGKEESYLTHLRQVDALGHIVRLFQNETVPHPDGSIDPIRDIGKLDAELVIADMVSIEKRLEKIELDLKKHGKSTGPNIDKERHLLERLQKILDEGRFIHEMELKEEDEKMIKGFNFLSEKSTVLIANIDEKHLNQPDNELSKKVKDYAQAHKVPYVEVCGSMEMELMDLTDTERIDFMKELGIEISAKDRVIKAVYEACDLITFYTVVHDEVHAWTITRGTNAPMAAGKIHTDFEHGFIRAEVIHYKNFVENPDLSVARHKGLLRLEGKEYIVQDGDIINFRFNV